MNEHPKFPASVSLIIYNEQGQILLVSADGKSDWRVVSGWLEQEAVFEGILREIREELGDVEVRVMDILDAHIFNYQDKIPLISIFGLVKYIQGDIRTQDDIEGYIWRWFGGAELKTLDIASPYQFEIIEKALFLIKVYQERPDLPFQKFKWKSLS
jgi:ADP-ribose pyrophosphatase YjhB (NUDIX family)